MVVNSGNARRPGLVGIPVRPDPRDLPGLGHDLRRAWFGYRTAILARLAEAGYADTHFPDGRVLRICYQSDQPTISQIGRELGITRQGAAKAVASLRERGYVDLADSPSDGREKVVTLTDHGTGFLRAYRQAATRIERELRTAVGEQGFDALRQLLHALPDVADSSG